MRSKTSFFNKTVFWKDITHFWPIWLIYTIALLCMVPLRMLVNAGLSYEGYSVQEIENSKKVNFIQMLFPGGSSTVIVLLAFGIGIVTAMAVFSYLYNNRSAHMFHALPVTRTELFVSNFLAGLCMIIVPAILTFILGTVFCIIQGITALQYLLMWLLVLIGESFFFYSLTVAVGMFTGQLLAIPIFVIILNVLFIGCRYIITYIIGTIGYGMSNSYANRINSIFSPAIYMSNKVGVEFNYMEDAITCHMYGMPVVGIYVLVGILLAILSLVLYRRRKLETTGDVLVIPATRPVFRWGMALCVAFLTANLLCMMLGSLIHTSLGNFLQVLFTVVIAGLIAFFIAEMILTKSLQVITRKRLIECGIMLGCAVVFLFCIKGNVFGLENKIPDKDEIVSANINGFFDIEETSQEGIDEIIDIHQQIIDSKKEFQAYQDSASMDRTQQWVEIDYKLTDGSLMVRTYYVPASRNYYENAKSVISQVYALSMEPDNYLRGKLMLNYDDKNNHLLSMELDTYGSDFSYGTKSIPEDEIEEVYEAYLKDIRAGHFYLDNGTEEYYAHTYVNGLYIHIYNSNGIMLSRSEKMYWGTEVPKDYYVSLELSDRCVYTINKLIELNIINSEDDLTTQQDIQMEYTMDE